MQQNFEPEPAIYTTTQQHNNTASMGHCVDRLWLDGIVSLRPAPLASVNANSLRILRNRQGRPLISRLEFCEVLKSIHFLHYFDRNLAQPDGYSVAMATNVECITAFRAEAEPERAGVAQPCNLVLAKPPPG